MDKKNTMLLTVIAVATLLVAVVGATFAYFGVYSTSELGATAVDATVEQVGTVTLSGGGSVSRDITAAEMAESAAPATYSIDTATVASAALTGAGATETYYCRFSLAVANASTVNTEAKDGGLNITVAEGVTVSGNFTKGTNVNPSTVAAGTYTVDFSMGADGTFDGGALITVNGAIINLEDDATQAGRLAGRKIDVDYTVSNFVCDTAPLA